MSRRRLHVALRVHAPAVQAWHSILARRLMARGHAVSVLTAPEGADPPRALQAFLQLERLVLARHAKPRWAGTMTADIPRTEQPDGPPDLIIDLTGSLAPPARTRTLQPLYDGHPAPHAAAAALLSGRAPTVALQDNAAPERPRQARPAIEDPLRLVLALDGLAVRIAGLLADAADEIAAGGIVAGEEPGPLRGGLGWSVLDALRLLPVEATRAITRLTQRAPHWYVGWRACDKDRLGATLTAPAKGWTRLPDDGRRFYADPIPVAAGGLRYVFMEEFSYTVGRGVISVLPFGPDGPIGAPRPVLQENWHLSYPFVFEHDGAWWLIPESSSERRIDLYRATAFPDGWERVTTLVDDTDASDATLHRHDDGRLYLFATVSEDGASTWDALAVWWADRLTGPWTRIGTGAVLVDAAAARPAGALFRRGDMWIRPVQDCSERYGGRLGLMRVEALSPDAFRQRTEAVVDAPPTWSRAGFHTLNWAAGLETVDGCGPRGLSPGASGD